MPPRVHRARRALENAITTQEPLRTLADLQLTGVPQTAPGELVVERLAGVATGVFREDPASSIAASAQLTRAEEP